MCERIERLVVNQFEKLTGVNASENQVMNFEVFPQKREALKQLLRSVLPDLRIYSSLGLVTVADFADYIEKAEKKKKAFFDKGLQIIRSVLRKPSILFLTTQRKPVLLRILKSRLGGSKSQQGQDSSLHMQGT